MDCMGPNSHSYNHIIRISDNKCKQSFWMQHIDFRLRNDSESNHTYSSEEESNNCKKDYIFSYGFMETSFR